MGLPAGKNHTYTAAHVQHKLNLAPLCHQLALPLNRYIPLLSLNSDLVDLATSLHDNIGVL